MDAGVSCLESGIVRGSEAIMVSSKSGRILAILSVCSGIGACAAGPVGGPDAGGFDAGAVDAGAADAGDAGCLAVEETPTIVNTGAGPVEGASSAGVRAWKGIPFAAPPVGSLRWRSPQPVACRDAVLETKVFGAKCAQLTPGSPREVEGSEDCLTLNVWSPAGASRVAKKPVMVWVHGGGNSLGSASEQLAGGTHTYDGADLATSGDVVVVTVQYRIGPFGWASHASLRSDGETGNYGLRDVLAALEWVRDEIAGFGGDGSKVTLFGESAGGLNTCALASSPRTRGLAHRFIIQSGGCVAATRTILENQQRDFPDNAGCGGSADVASCLRAKSMEVVLRALPEDVAVSGGAANPWDLHVDGEVLAGQPDIEVGSGDGVDAPVLIGANARETSRAVPPLASCDAYETAVTLQFNSMASRILLQYPCAAYDTPQRALEAVTTDARFVCGARRNARAFFRGKTTPTYRYHFTHGLSRGPGASDGAFHGLEVLFVFGNGMDSLVAVEADRTLSAAMQRYWTRFAHTGDPNGGSDPAWPAIAEEDERALHLGTTIEAKADDFATACDFWDTLIP